MKNLKFIPKFIFVGLAILVTELFPLSPITNIGLAMPPACPGFGVDGGGGGGGGGLVVIAANRITGTTTITALGGAGYSNGAGTQGGGGGGGVIWIALRSYNANITDDVSGGAGANTGSSGTSRIFQINDDGSLTERTFGDSW